MIASRAQYCLMVLPLRLPRIFQRLCVDFDGMYMRKVIWLDAICIGQANTLKRNSQERRTWDVFGRQLWCKYGWGGRLVTVKGRPNLPTSLLDITKPSRKAGSLQGPASIKFLMITGIGIGRLSTHCHLRRGEAGSGLCKKSPSQIQCS